MTNETFEEWAIVELFGHRIIAGKVSEQIIANQGFVRVDVPKVDDQNRYTKLYGSNAIYCITPTDEHTARSAAAGLKQEPIEVWKLNLPQLEVQSGQRPELEDFNGQEDLPF